VAVVVVAAGTFAAVLTGCVTAGLTAVACVVGGLFNREDEDGGEELVRMGDVEVCCTGTTGATTGSVLAPSLGFHCVFKRFDVAE